MDKQIAYATIYEEIGSLRNSIKGFEKKIAECHSSILHWKSRHNSLSNISRLPDELLVEIWKYLIFTPARVSMRWLSVTHVCSHWRRVALSCPVLWSWPSLHRPQAVSLLQRAMTSEFTLVVKAEELCGLSDDTGNPAVDMACSVLPTTETIFLDLPIYDLGTHTMRHIRNFLVCLHQPGNTSNLRRLQITYPAFPSEAGQADLRPFEVLWNSPQLRTLLLVNCVPFNPSVQPSAISSLTRLEVSTPHQNLVQASPFRHVLQALRCLPHLTVLALFSVFKPLDDEDISWHRNSHSPVVFSAMHDMCVEASAQSSYLFMDSVRYPHSAVIEIQGLWEEDSGHIPVINSLHSLLATTTRRISPPILRLHVGPMSVDDEWLVTFAFKDRPKQDVLRVFIPPKLQTLGTISELPRICPLGNLQRFIYHLHSSDMEVWKSFGRIKTLRALEIDVALHPTFLRVYASLWPSGDIVFEPHGLGEGLWQLYEANSRTKRAEMLYFNNPDFDVLMIRGTSSNSIWLCSREEVDRLFMTRANWKGYSGRWRASMNPGSG